MDNVTHSLFALTLARTRAARAVPGATAALLVASNAPDIDIVTAFTGGTAAYLGAHRGITHGPLGVLLLALVIASIVWIWAGRRRDHREQAITVFVRLLLVSMAGVALHILMDLPTVYGTRLLSPFSDRWVSFDWLPIIDLHLWAALIGGLIAAALRPAATRSILVAVLLVMAANYLVRAVAHDQALSMAGLPSPMFRPASWPGDPRGKLTPCAGVEPRSGADACHAVAVPTFLSPFQWRIIYAFEDRYELGDANVLDRSISAPRARHRIDRGRLTDRAAEGPTAQTFLSFARVAAAWVATAPSGEATVTFRDLRFVRQDLATLNQDDPGGGAFTLTSRFGADGALVTEQLRD